MFKSIRLTLLGLFAAVALLAAPGAASAAGPALPDNSITALFKLTHPRGLQGFAQAVSTPGSPRYQQYRSVKWIVKRYGATKKTKKRAMRWLAARGIEARPDATGQTIIATMSKSQADSFLEPGASVSSVSTGGDGRVPAGLRGAVTGMSFLDPDPGKFQTNAEVDPEPVDAEADVPVTKAGFSPTVGSSRERTGTPAGCAAGQGKMVNKTGGSFTPNQYLDAYGHAALHKQGFKGQGMTMAVVEIDGFKRSDIEAFADCFGFRAPPTPIALAGINKKLAPGDETTLDLEVIAAAAPGLKKIHVYEGSSSEAGLMISMGSALGNAKNQPDTISMSIGGCEPLLTGTLQYTRAMDNILAVAVGAGIPFFVSSGDVGSAGCTMAGNSNALPLKAVQSPASSKYVTSVGGTNFSLNAKNQITEEVVWNNAPAGVGAGAGGLSILAKDRPWYQRTKEFGGTGPTRALPDIVGLADGDPGYAIYCTSTTPDTCGGLGWVGVGGTSAATPLMAAGMTLINQKREKSGKKSLGFINPLLYKIGQSKAYKTAVRDVTLGNNDPGTALPRPAGEPQEALGGYPASKGFDLASGWGSLKLTGFAKVATKYEPKKRK